MSLHPQLTVSAVCCFISSLLVILLMLNFFGNACQNLTSFESLFPEYSKLFIFYCLDSGEKFFAIVKGTSVYAHCELEWRGELILPLLCSRHCFCPGYYPSSERSSFLLDGGDSSILWAFSLCHLKARISIMLENG